MPDNEPEEGLCGVCGKRDRTPGFPRMCDGKHDRPLLHCIGCHVKCGRTVTQLGAKPKSPLVSKLKNARAESDTTLAEPKTESLKLVESCLQYAPAPVPQERPAVCETTRKDKAPYSLQQLAKQYTERALDTIVKIMEDPEEEGSTRVDAAKALLDRGWGKPTATIKQETIKYTMGDLEKKLLEHKSDIEKRMAEAKEMESAHLAEYISIDAVVVEDTASHSGSALQDHS